MSAFSRSFADAAPPPTDATESTVRRLKRAFARDESSRYDARALLWASLFYATYLGAVFEFNRWWAFAVVGFIASLRVFNASHMTFHAGAPRQRAWRLSRWVIIINAPWMLGYRDFKKNHLLHHAHVDTERDPEHYMQLGSPLRGLFNALTEPEQAIARQLRLFGPDRILVTNLVVYALAYAGLMWIGGWEGFVYYNLVARIGNAAAWWTASYWLHQPKFYEGGVRMSGVFAAIYAKFFGAESINGLRYHGFHHRYPWIPDRLLPLAASAAEDDTV